MTNQNPQFINSYFSNLLYYKSFDNLVFDYDAAELQAFQMFKNSDLFAPSIPTMTPDGSFNTPIKNVQQVIGFIKTVTQNGTGLIITFSDPTLATFRVRQKVNDNLMNEAIVTASAPGTVTLAPLTNPTSLTSGTHFKVNTQMTAVGLLASSFNSVGTTSIYDQKDVQTDWTEITRETIQIARMEKMNLLMSTTPTGEEVFYGYTENEKDAFNRMLWQVCYKYMFGKGAAGIQLPDGVGSKTMSIRNRIIQDSGNYVQTSGVPIDQTTFEQMIVQAATVNPIYGADIHVFPGIRALQQIGKFYPTQMGFAAATRTGEHMGISLDTREIFIAGIKVKIMTNFNLLNSAKIPDWHKDSVYILNLAPTVFSNGQKGKMVQLIHSSPDAKSTSAFIRKEITGMTGSSLGNNTGMGSIGQNELTATNVDGTTVEFLDHSGIAMVAKGHGLFENIH